MKRVIIKKASPKWMEFIKKCKEEDKILQEMYFNIIKGSTQKSELIRLENGDGVKAV